MSRILIGFSSTTVLIGSLGFAGAVHSQTISYSTSVFATTPAAPAGVAVDSAGNVYFSTGNAVEKVSAGSGGVVSLMAGNVVTAGSGDGPGTSALFNKPLGLAVDASGNVYVADSGNNAIRKVIPTGEVSTLAGLTQGFKDGVGIGAEFNNPTSVAVDPSGNVYVVDYGNVALRIVTPGGAVTTLLQPNGLAASFNGVAAAGAIKINGVAVDKAGVPYVTAEFETGTALFSPPPVTAVFKGTDSKTFTQLSGAIAPEYVSNSMPLGLSLAVDSTGIIYVALPSDSPIGAVEIIKQDGTVSDSSIGTPSNSESEFVLGGVAVDAAGRVYFADAVLDEIELSAPVGPELSIASEPTGASISFGENTTLSVTATGAPPLSYQWQVNGIAIAGATSSRTRPPVPVATQLLSRTQPARRRLRRPTSFHLYGLPISRRVHLPEPDRAC